MYAGEQAPVHSQRRLGRNVADVRQRPTDLRPRPRLGDGSPAFHLLRLSLLGLLVAAHVVALAIRGKVTLPGGVVPISFADGFRLADLVRAVAERLRGGKPAAADRRGFCAESDGVGLVAEALDEPGHEWIPCL